MNNQENEPLEVEQKKVRRRIPVTVVVGAIITLVACLAGLAIGGQMFKGFRQQRLLDAGTILLLQVERQGNLLVQTLRKTLTDAPDPVEEDWILEVAPGGGWRPIQGPLAHNVTSVDLGVEGIDVNSTAQHLTVSVYGGELFLVFYRKETLILRKCSLDVFTQFFANSRESRDAAIYIANRHGNLIYSNSPAVNSLDFVNRPLVQAFITKPLSQAQLNVVDDSDRNILGSFSEISHSNLVIFAEAREDLALASWRRALKRCLIGAAACLIIFTLGLAIAFNLRVRQPDQESSTS